MSRMRFGCFLAPHHPLGEHPMLLLRRDLDFAAHLDQLGFDEFWCGEHHSTGWEMIGSPEVFLAAAAERTARIKLGTGVISLPYHHPFTVAQRLVQLDHQSGGRLMFGSGPGALPSDAAMLGIDPLVQRDRQDEALGVIVRLLRGDRVSHVCEWFELHDAALHFLPLQEQMPMTVASSISPSGMTLAGKYGIGALSIASTSSEGLASLPTQWAFAEKAAAESGSTVHREDWRVLMSFHLAESREQARAEAVDGLQRWHNEYNVDVLARPGAVRVEDKWKLLDSVSGGGAAGGGTSVIGTPDDMIEAIRRMIEVTGGFGCVLGFAHDWANREATFRSWELFARYVIPEIQGILRPMRASADHVIANQKTLMAGAGAAIVAQIRKTPGASEEFAITLAQAAARGAGAGSSAGSSAAAGAALGDPSLNAERANGSPG
jgi:limonene 1,2-monooxygenase